MTPMMDQYDNNTLNTLLQENIEQARQADSFEKTRQMICQKMGVDPCCFIAIVDCMELYNVFELWKQTIPSANGVVEL